jgi:hypothetical protein
MRRLENGGSVCGSNGCSTWSCDSQLPCIRVGRMHEGCREVMADTCWWDCTLGRCPCNRSVSSLPAVLVVCVVARPLRLWPRKHGRRSKLLAQAEDRLLGVCWRHGTCSLWGGFESMDEIGFRKLSSCDESCVFETGGARAPEHTYSCRTLIADKCLGA